MSRFAPLFDALAKTSADELRLLVGERIYIMRKGTRQDIGKEPLKFTNIDPLAAELLSPEEVRGLKDTPKTCRVDHASGSYFVTFGRNAEGTTVAIRPEAKGNVQKSLNYVELLKPRQAFFTHISHDLPHARTEELLPPHVRLAYDGLQVRVEAFH